MGNRAFITTEKRDLGLYLHWNGGRDSVEAFLEYCKLRGYSSPEYQGGYGWARMAQVIGNYFGGGNSIGIEAYPGDEEARSIADDNGVYIIKDFEIVDRVYPDNGYWHGEQSRYDLTEMLVEIDQAQPEREQLGAEYITAPMVPLSSLNVGDEVWFQDWHGQTQRTAVIGIGEPGKVVNGSHVGGIPYVGLYGNQNPADNCNNYLARHRPVWNEAEARFDVELDRTDVRLASRAQKLSQTASPKEVADAASRVAKGAGEVDSETRMRSL